MAAFKKILVIGLDIVEFSYYIPFMVKVLDFLAEQNAEELASRYRKLFDLDKSRIDASGIEKILETLKTEPPVSPDVECVVHYISADESLGGEGFWEVVGESFDDATLYSIGFAPWGEWREMRVRIEGDLDELDAACYIIHELTFYGGPEEQAEHRASLQAAVSMISIDDAIEISPGIVVAPQVAAAMERDGKMAEFLKGLTFESLVSSDSKRILPPKKKS